MADRNAPGGIQGEFTVLGTVGVQGGGNVHWTQPAGCSARSPAPQVGEQGESRITNRPPRRRAPTGTDADGAVQSSYLMG